MPGKYSPYRPFPTYKSQGEWVQMVFMVKAASLGMAVSQPFGDSQPFDMVVVPESGRTVRVQVKSGWRKLGGRYHVRMWKAARPYRRSEVEFFVVYIPPEDAWYVIPVEEVWRMVMRFYPHARNSRGKYEKYRNAWRLITGNPQDDERTMGFTIHAQAE